MSFEIALPWLALLLLGAWHGVNPGMGWLFAVALGMQEQRERAVWRALAPLALGHGLAIGVAVALAAVVGLVIPPAYLKWLVAATLLGFGIFKLVRTRHPRYGGMQVGARELAVWSFLMGSAHGAGLMVLPFALEARGAVAGMEAGHGVQAAAVLSGAQLTGLAVTVVHTFAYLLMTGLVALVVYRKLGLRLLGTAWINLDLIWAVALIATALVVPLI